MGCFQDMEEDRIMGIGPITDYSMTPSVRDVVLLPSDTFANALSADRNETSPLELTCSFGHHSLFTFATAYTRLLLGNSNFLTTSHFPPPTYLCIGAVMRRSLHRIVVLRCTVREAGV